MKKVIILFLVVLSLLIGITILVTNLSKTKYYIQIDDTAEWIFDEGVLTLGLFRSAFSEGGLYYYGDEDISITSLSNRVYILSKDGETFCNLDTGGHLSASPSLELSYSEHTGSSGWHSISGIKKNDNYNLEQAYLEVSYTTVDGEYFTETYTLDIKKEGGYNKLPDAFTDNAISKENSKGSALFYIGQIEDEVLEICEEYDLFYNTSIINPDAGEDGFPPEGGDTGFTIGNKNGIGLFIDKDNIVSSIYIRNNIPNDFGFNFEDELNKVENAMGDDYSVLGKDDYAMSIEYDLGDYYMIVTLEIDKSIFGKAISYKVISFQISNVSFVEFYKTNY
jgi:hypothetical protein